MAQERNEDKKRYLLVVDMCLPDSNIVEADPRRKKGSTQRDYKDAVEAHLANGGHLVFMQMQESIGGRKQGVTTLTSSTFEDDLRTYVEDLPTRTWLSELMKKGGALGEGKINLLTKSLESGFLSKSQMEVQMHRDVDIEKWGTEKDGVKLLEKLSGENYHTGKYLLDVMKPGEVGEVIVLGANLTHCVVTNLVHACALYPTAVVRVEPYVVLDAALDGKGDELPNADINAPTFKMKAKKVMELLKDKVRGLNENKFCGATPEALAKALESLTQTELVVDMGSKIDGGVGRQIIANRVKIEVEGPARAVEGWPSPS